MARGKLSLEEARKAKQLRRFAKETPYQSAEPTRFERLLRAMASGEPPDAGKRPAKRRTSGRDADED